MDKYRHSELLLNLHSLLLHHHQPQHVSDREAEHGLYSRFRRTAKSRSNSSSWLTYPSKKRITHRVIPKGSRFG
jgi:hypothetical protein